MLDSIHNVLNIAYSKLFDLPIPWNSKEVYEAACEYGFDGIKGDVAPSSDGKLIMCHDPEFQFDENGRVYEPGHVGSYAKQICDMTGEECTALEYALSSAKDHLGYYAHVAELEDLIRICKEHGKFAYITVRDYQIDQCVEEVYRLLIKYDMTRNCIVNSFTPETLTAMRKKDANIMLSYVFGPDVPLTKEIVDTAIALGNCVVCFYMQRECQFEGKVYEQSKDALRYAKEKGVILHLAFATDQESYQLGLQRGFTGFQCLTSDAFR